MSKPTEQETKAPEKEVRYPHGRKWQLTINNPIEKGFDHEYIKMTLPILSSLVYACLSDEKDNENETLRTHIYIACSSLVRYTTIKRIFNSAHVKRVQGTSQENRDFIAKDGKWKNTEKANSSIPNSFEEFGEMPTERDGSTIEALILKRIQEGATNAEIIREFPNYLRGKPCRQF